MKISDIAAMWIVAVSLVGAVGAQGMLPDTPPRLAYGVEAFVPGPEFTEPGVAGPVVPPALAMREQSVPVLAVATFRTPDLVEVFQGLTRRVFGC